jgi:predicted transglutaminase-like cysteine proteinase
MKKEIRTILSAFAIAFATAGAAGAAAAASEPALFISVGTATRAPIGWVEFCKETPDTCAPQAGMLQEIVLTQKTWAHLVHINNLVNARIKPMTDMDHWGVAEKWSYPDDGYGDCEDYVLLKRRMLAEAGWPLSSLLVTVVRDQNGDGHAVLTVKTDKGEFVLDNQNAEVLLWSETNYHYVKRQSQQNPNTWVALGDPRPAPLTASSR